METFAQKVELRERMRVMLATTPSSQVRAKSAAIWEKLAVLEPFVSAERLLCYVSKGNEVDTHGLIQQLLAMGKRVCVPKFDQTTKQYIASEVRDFTQDLAEGQFRILEPKAEAVRPVAVQQLQALVTPGLAFDENGNRLGRGMAYFDGMLREARGTKIALAYDFQVLKEVPVDAHDVPMDLIVTETRVVKCQR